MSNSYFRFKQFTINQDKCAMKVSTDACIQGAWTPVIDKVKNVLDIGTGTGLLSLMLAQRTEQVYIDAVELDEDAAGQAKQNIEASPWGSRINVLQGDVCNYQFDKKYDLIICNPPFFQNSLLGPDKARNSVRHNTTLSFADLAQAIIECLMPSGYCSILLPYAEFQSFKTIMEIKGLVCFNELLISPNSRSHPNRIVGLFSAPPVAPKFMADSLCVYSAVNSYTAGFTQLLSPFYLKL